MNTLQTQQNTLPGSNFTQKQKDNQTMQALRKKPKNKYTQATIKPTQNSTLQALQTKLKTLLSDNN